MSAIRALRQLTSTSTRAWRSSVNVATASRRAALLARPVARSFSVSARVFGEGATDVALSQKLTEELQYEKEAAAEVSAEPDFLKGFKAQGVWKLDDVAGNDEVSLSRKFGNEDVRVMFSIADIQTEQETEFEEEAEGQSEDEPAHSYPIRCSISITKDSAPGALTVDAMCQDGAFIVDNISFYKDAKVGTELTAEADWNRRGLYIGPQFDTLDVGVQEEFERFLQERGINDSLAVFIPEYSEYKEQKEYVHWLANVKSFVEA
ncbi:mitochondrial glycoprotein [Abortiporus biennis]|nr:mitochondrial glycoprotein [Abortiporus biennis]